MKEELSKLDKVLQQQFIENEELVLKNIEYLKLMGIKKPELLIVPAPELFLLPNKIVQKKMDKIDINLVNKDYNMILEML